MSNWWPYTNALSIQAYKPGTDESIPRPSNYNDTYWYEGDEYASPITVRMYEKNKIQCEQWFGAHGNTQTIESGGTFVTKKAHGMYKKDAQGNRPILHNHIYRKSAVAATEYSLVIMTAFDVLYCHITFKYDANTQTYTDIKVSNETPHLEYRASVVGAVLTLNARTEPQSAFPEDEYASTILIDIQSEAIMRCRQQRASGLIWNTAYVHNQIRPYTCNVYATIKAHDPPAQE